MATKWGIASVGLISTDFVLALGTLPNEEHQVVACAARDLTRAKQFSEEHSIARSYGCYEELAKDSEVQVVYIGSINTEHLRLGKLFLEAGKHVLCEKPLCMNQKDVQELVNLARAKKLFLMEAIWSRFNPVYQKLREQLTSGIIGDPYLVHADFGVKLSDKERVTKRALGGSALLDIGVYCIQFALFVLGRPESVKAIGNANSEGVDEIIHVLFQYPNGKAAVLNIQTKVLLPNEAKVYGTNGEIRVHTPFWTPTQLSVNGDVVFTNTLPETRKPTRYTNSAALRYEAAEVRRCLLAGLTESPELPLDESLAIAGLEDEIRRQVGIVFEQD